MTASANVLPMNEQPDDLPLIARLWTYWSMNHLKGPARLARELAIFVLHAVLRRALKRLGAQKVADAPRSGVMGMTQKHGPYKPIFQEVNDG